MIASMNEEILVMPFDPTKPAQTRDGRKARIICTDRIHECGRWSIIALVCGGPPPGTEHVISYMSDGRKFLTGESEEDLINVPERVTKYVNVYKDRLGDFNQILDRATYIAATKGDSLGTIALHFEDDKLVDVEIVS